MPPVEFEPTISVFEGAKSVHALHRAATVIGILDTVPTVTMCCILLLVRRKGIFVSVNTTIQVKVITSNYINVNYYMFRPLFAHHQVYL
jgi:hypothetical protein